MLMRIVILSVFLLFLINSKAQEGKIKGRIFDEINNEAIIGADIIIQGTTIGTSSDLEGNFVLDKLTPGNYNLEVSYLGYQTKLIADISVSNSTIINLDIALKETSNTLAEVVILASPFYKPQETPLSLNSLGINEIKRSPGGNRDISKVVRLLPGVGNSASFRNDLLVRGGGPSENKFFIDDVEIPTINHFVTQGGSGGSNGLINTDFISNVDFYSAGFPASRYGVSSALLEFTQKDGRNDKVGATITVGASDLALTLEGPLSKNKKNSFLISARRSYLQLLFKAIGLPFLPTYNDFQLKTTHKINANNDITFVGLGALDDFVLNSKLKDGDETNQYLYNNLPYISQWNYTVGIRYRHFLKNGYIIAVASRNLLKNNIYKYQDNDNNNADKRLFDLNSFEGENKLRYEHIMRIKGYKLSYGINYEYDKYTNSTFRKIAINDTTNIDFTYSTLLKLQRFGFFVQTSKKYFDDKLTLSIGLRADGSNYNDATKNPFKQLSPRLSIAYDILPQLSINTNIGLYYQMPVYTLLGYKNAEGRLQNKNTLKYIQNFQWVGGLSYLTNFNTKFSIEGFYKKYNNYPLLTNKGISFANEGGFFGVVGDEATTATSAGKAYGVELLIQQKIYKGLFGIFSYTYFRSLFTDFSGKYQSASWDTRHIMNLSAGYKFKKNWEIGFRYRISGGAPYTPYDINASALKVNWDIRGEGILDYSQVNQKRLKPYQQLDIRVDKKWFFKKWNLNPFIDIQNITFSTEDQSPYIDTKKDDAGVPLTDPEDETRYQTKFLPNSAGSLLPTVGVVVEF